MTLDSENHLGNLLNLILRGAAKLLGCSSANLILFDVQADQISIRVGAMASSQADLAQVEKLLGRLEGRVFTVAAVIDSLVYASYRERAIKETSFLRELAGNTFHPTALGLLDSILGAHRYVMVPVTYDLQTYGVLVFEKHGHEPFSDQQREVLLRYAHRIGAILHGDHSKPKGVSLKNSPESVQEDEDLHLMRIALSQSAATLLLDPDLRITSVNDASISLFKLEGAALRGHHIGDLFVEPGEVQGILNRQLLFLSSGYFEEAALLRRNDGSTFSGNVGALLLADDENRVIGYLVRIRELSAGAAVAVGTEDVERLIRRERLATMGEMAAQLAHEIRNPLVAVGASIDSLVRDPTIGGPNRELLEDMRGELTRLDMLLRDYLSMASKKSPGSDVVELSSLIREVSTRMASLPAAQGRKIHLNLPENIAVSAKRDALYHLFFNLLLNAIELIPKDGFVKVSAAVSKDDVQIFVDDNGPGLICSSDQCFEPFFTTKSNGSGLGLTVCKQIAEGAGGDVFLQNRTTGGCRATVTLPLAGDK